MLRGEGFDNQGCCNALCKGKRRMGGKGGNKRKQGKEEREKRGGSEGGRKGLTGNDYDACNRERGRGWNLGKRKLSKSRDSNQQMSCIVDYVT